MASKYKPVVQNFIRTADKIYQLTYEDGTVIETTWSHPFYIEWANWKAAARSMNCEAVLQVCGWVKAEELRAGDVSKTDKGTLRIAIVHVDVRSEEVYNFEVAENHTYLVTDQGVVVHNAENYAIRFEGKGNHTHKLKVSYDSLNGEQSTEFLTASLEIDADGNKIYTNDNGDRLIVSSDGKTIVHEYSEGANKFRKELGVENKLQHHDRRRGTFSGRYDLEESNNLALWNGQAGDKGRFDPIVRGSFVHLDKQTGKMRVVDPAQINSADVFVHGIMNSQLDMLGSIGQISHVKSGAERPRGGNSDIYGLYWGSGNGGKDFIQNNWEVDHMRNNLDDLDYMNGAADLSKLLQEGRVNNLICHSGGAALCMQSVNAAENKNIAGLENTRMLAIGPANRYLPEPGTLQELKIVVNEWNEPIRLDRFDGREEMIDQAKQWDYFRDGSGASSGHFVSSYLDSIGCFYGRRDKCADPNGLYMWGRHPYIPPRRAAGH